MDSESTPAEKKEALGQLCKAISSIISSVYNKNTGHIKQFTGKIKQECRPLNSLASAIYDHIVNHIFEKTVWRDKVSKEDLGIFFFELQEKLLSAEKLYIVEEPKLPVPVEPQSAAVMAVAEPDAQFTKEEAQRRLVRMRNAWAGKKFPGASECKEGNSSNKVEETPSTKIFP
jgi:hypothetical protein